MSTRVERKKILWSVAIGLAATAVILVACADKDEKTTGAGGSYGGGLYKVGSPYRIKGQWYSPAVDYEYEEVGTASWYGSDFHGKPTANGETYDMDELTAAHRTLPLPSVVRVTNLENGRSTVLRVNDRGPFSRGRIIDVSRKGAKVLGFYRQGTARVRVEIIADESRDLHARLTGQPSAETVTADVTLAAAAPPENPGQVVMSNGVDVRSATDPTKDVVVSSVPVAPPRSPPPVTTSYLPPTGTALPPAGSVFVQAGAYAVVENANQVAAALTGLGPTHIVAAEVNGRRFYRVRLGPFDSRNDAQRLLTHVINSGYADSRVVID